MCILTCLDPYPNLWSPSSDCISASVPSDTKVLSFEYENIPQLLPFLTQLLLVIYHAIWLGMSHCCFLFGKNQQSITWGTMADRGSCAPCHTAVIVNCFLITIIAISLAFNSPDLLLITMWAFQHIVPMPHHVRLKFSAYTTQTTCINISPTLTNWVPAQPHSLDHQYGRNSRTNM